MNNLKKKSQVVLVNYIAYTNFILCKCGNNIKFHIKKINDDSHNIENVKSIYFDCYIDKISLKEVLEIKNIKENLLENKVDPIDYMNNEGKIIYCSSECKNIYNK